MNLDKNLSETLLPTQTPVGRRGFIMRAGGLVVGGALVAQACRRDNNNNDDTPTPQAVNLGSGDVSVLNYALVLEQLEAEFYTQVVANGAFNTAFPDETQRRLIVAIRDHEIAHRDFLNRAIPEANRIPRLTFNFSQINFAERGSVLQFARTFEDLGVSAYNGAGQLFSETSDGANFLTIAGKIVSVEARHAAYIRDLISNGSFADLASLTNLGAQTGPALDVAASPQQVLGIAGPFIRNTINASGMPTS